MLYSYQYPLLVYDGDCGFCKFWIRRLQRLTGRRVWYAPSEDVLSDFPAISPGVFDSTVVFIDSDRQHYTKAAAVFLTLKMAGFGLFWWLYRSLGVWRWITDGLYYLVARHRGFFSRLTTLFFGRSNRPTSFGNVAWWFSKGMGISYGLAFSSLYTQILGLFGSQGILSISDRLIRLKAAYPNLGFFELPSVFLWNASDGMLLGVVGVGIMFSIGLISGVLPFWSALGAWICYLSLLSASQVFLSFQWDALLIEMGFLVLLLTPVFCVVWRRGRFEPGWWAVLAIRVLMVRFMVSAGLVKWVSGDTLWRSFDALSVHYWSQPIPNPVSWFVHQLPSWFHRLSVFSMFVIELIVPFFVFFRRRIRWIGFWLLVMLQGVIFFTGNYGFFNVLVVCLMIWMLDDDALIRRSSSTIFVSNRIGVWRRWGTGVIAVVLVLWGLSLESNRFLGTSFSLFPKAQQELAPFRLVNGYGLFAVMTDRRYEIVLEASLDGKTWESYEFSYKPFQLNVGGRQIAPFQPRLDWQMWFAALSTYTYHPWIFNVVQRLFEGSEDVEALFESIPFDGARPRYIRAKRYDYRFTSWRKWRETGLYWRREAAGDYFPILVLKN